MAHAWKNARQKQWSLKPIHKATNIISDTRVALSFTSHRTRRAKQIESCTTKDLTSFVPTPSSRQTTQVIRLIIN